MERDSFVEFLDEQLAPLGHVVLRPMFGMFGVFCDGVMLGIAGDGALYLRVDDGNRHDFAEAAHEPPLSYVKNGKRIDLSFWRAPERLFDDPDEFLDWARSALAAAVRVAAKRPKVARTRPKPDGTPPPAERRAPHR